MENNQNFEPQKSSEEIKISKKSLYIGIGILLVAVCGAGGYFLLSDKNKDTTPNKAISDSTVVKQDSAKLAKQDSARIPNEEGEYDEPSYSEFRIISSSISLPSGQALKFGDKVYVHYEDYNKEDPTVFLENPDSNPNAQKIILNKDMVIEDYSFSDFKNKFSLPPYNTLPSNIKKELLAQDGRYFNQSTYNITQNAERAKSTLASGDFDGDGIKDYAIILDDNENQNSRLIIISVNKATKKAYLAFAENYYNKLKVKSFSKGASIYMNSSAFVKAPREGVLIIDEGGSTAILYDANAQRFKPYEQIPMGEASAVADEVE